ncbi:hypothetical protein QJS04_geneDACA013821 [Acorus gramineus]|uniref:Uncharacterized protein n=1 Tax=Acorus gramineus TaxID=55184 RepID=A0AAV9AUG6_ACOGR|nr:hypothetical protein QJS04_geneDACA013821 [Acorus gramineus]
MIKKIVTFGWQGWLPWRARGWLTEDSWIESADRSTKGTQTEGMDVFAEGVRTEGADVSKESSRMEGANGSAESVRRAVTTHTKIGRRKRTWFTQKTNKHEDPNKIWLRKFSRTLIENSSIGVGKKKFFFFVCLRLL